MDIITEAREWIETDHILCAVGYEQAEDIIPALLTKLEEKEREVEVNEKAYLWEKEQKDLLKAENERLMIVVDEYNNFMGEI